MKRFCYVPLMPTVETDLTNTYEVDGSFCGDPFEDTDFPGIAVSCRILLRTYSELTESYYYKKEFAYTVPGLIGLYLQRESSIF